MSALFGLFGLIVTVGFLIALIIYIKRRYIGSSKTSRRNRPILSGGGWHFINKTQTPRWIINKWRYDGIDWSYGTITEEIKHARGSHYEYKLVVVDSGHTHNAAVIRRKLRRH